MSVIVQPEMGRPMSTGDVTPAPWLAWVSTESAGVERGPWVADALCREYPGVSFFPGRGESVAEARVLCQRCLVREECLEYALASGERFGIWGGLSERERRRLRAADASSPAHLVRVLEDVEVPAVAADVGGAFVDVLVGGRLTTDERRAVRAAMVSAGVSLGELAAMVGRGPCGLRQVLKGARPAGTLVRRRLCEVLEIAGVEDLAGDHATVV